MAIWKLIILNLRDASTSHYFLPEEVFSKYASKTATEVANKYLTNALYLKFKKRRNWFADMDSFDEGFSLKRIIRAFIFIPLG